MSGAKSALEAFAKACSERGVLNALVKNLVDAGYSIHHSDDGIGIRLHGKPYLFFYSNQWPRIAFTLYEAKEEIIIDGRDYSVLKWYIYDATTRQITERE